MIWSALTCQRFSPFGQRQSGDKSPHSKLVRPHSPVLALLFKNRSELEKNAQSR